VFLYTGYIRVYPALIFKILTKKKNKNNPLKNTTRRALQAADYPRLFDLLGNTVLARSQAIKQHP
jgi:hypothetical protein